MERGRAGAVQACGCKGGRGSDISTARSVEQEDIVGESPGSQIEMTGGVDDDHVLVWAGFYGVALPQKPTVGPVICRDDDDAQLYCPVGLVKRFIGDVARPASKNQDHG